MRAALLRCRLLKKNIGERLEALKKQYHHQRQRSITSELLDIVSGFEVLMNDR
jgi:F-type H+-transporting ATPase subunit gamma